MRTINSSESTKHIWILLFISLSIFILISRSPVSHTGSDPRASLLLSQVIIEEQSIKLDKYKDANYGFAIQEKNQHSYYYFPIGTSISAIPFILFERYILNNDMSDRNHEGYAQKQIAAIVIVLIFLLLYQIAKMYLNPTISILVAISFLLSTSLSSTLGQALWSQDFASFYALLAIFLTLKIIKNNNDIYWIGLGIVLFMAYLTRPTMSLLSIALIIFLFFNDKKYIAVKTASLVGVLLIAFVVFSISEFNQLLPDYYMPKRLSSETFWIALHGNLFSPARGLFVYSPFLLVFLLNFKITYNMFKANKSLFIIVLWILLHLLIISKFPQWWAGWSYGPRFMIDVLPAIYLLFVIYLSLIYHKKSIYNEKLISIFLVVSISLAIYFNLVQGLYNNFSGALWNSNPNIDKNPHLLFDWKYPQFLHNEKRHIERIKEHNKDLQLTLKASELPSQIGIINGDNRIANSQKDKSGYLTFGPYLELFEGDYKYDILFESSENDTTEVGFVDITINQEVVSQDKIYGTNSKEIKLIGQFTITEDTNKSIVEIRNFYNGRGDLTIKKLSIMKVK